MYSCISVLLADDHSMVRQGLKQLIDLEDDIEVLAQASNGVEAIELYNKVKPNVILLDINMPHKNGIDALKEIRLLDKQVKIIILTIHQDKEYLLKAIELGANGYILKDSDASVLTNAIREVYYGKSFVQPSILEEELIECNLNKIPCKNNINLTDREIDVIKLIAEGLLNKEIAERLYISEKTVKNHVSNIFKKINVSDRTQAAVFAIKNKLFSI